MKLTGMKLIGMKPVEWKKVRIFEGFWGPKVETNRKITIPAIYTQLRLSGRLESLRLQWKPGMPNKPHPYWDSDIAKWIEAASYSLALHPDPDLETAIEQIVDLYAQGQWADGYINTYFTMVEPSKRWTNVYVMHELYCAGHLLEASLAYYLATGRSRFLDMLIRFIHHIEDRFGPQPGQIKGYPGHEELELALIRLFRLTRDQRYLNLASYFIEERGKQPYFFELEARMRGEDPDHSPYKEILNKNYLPAGPYALFQAHLPVREQKTAEGHAVRAMYLYAAMADLAKETQDDTLVAACETLWKSVTRKRMYITGGIGSQDVSERFTFDYDLPNETAYNETCASIGLVFWAHRMLHVTGQRDYADIMELALYNGVLSGVSLSGDTFFYCNHLEVETQLYTHRVIRNPRMEPVRKPWYEVSCCPPNLARLLASLGQYIYSWDPQNLYVHLFIQSEVEIPHKGSTLRIRQITRYPWEGKVRFHIETDGPVELGFNLRIPGWCSSYRIELNGKPWEGKVESTGYVRVFRTWQGGDTLELDLAMPVERIEAHPFVRMDTYKIALKRGPLVYCLEEIDHGDYLPAIRMDVDSPLEASYDPALLGGVVTIQGEAEVLSSEGWDGQLYRPKASRYKKTSIRGIPYFAWGNRGMGNMIVWIHSR